MSARVTGLATPKEIADSVKRTVVPDVIAQLDELTSKFVQAAKLIDPTITGGWVGRDGDALDRVYFVHLERETKPFVRKTS